MVLQVGHLLPFCRPSVRLSIRLAAPCVVLWLKAADDLLRFPIKNNGFSTISKINKMVFIVVVIVIVVVIEALVIE